MSHQFIATERIPARSNRAEVRNPILTLPAVARLRALDPETRGMLRDLLLELQQDARERAEASWRSRKPPLAAYWAACGVYAGHIARAIGPGACRKIRLVRRG
ncbi:hypothetical protein HJG53_16270 [Sphingomonas sp. ID1715]|jgi:hypothetical protein|uniref:hypothetical protein n=1 Tax=Sphingomonadales TaxID=204457 RepID=UPI0003828F8D|nr:MULTISPECIES: hypothetical protein [Sphingomonadaceae]NNM78445.1 hypothetical protein [Sphingomonas sp. ID1715]HUD30171.1 hypothetical protein [Novosphingobium sp.]|tara:strand:- start:2132 stop:2440 length:309 start_codon:yes stop_codon:yes gene_type:complete